MTASAPTESRSIPLQQHVAELAAEAGSTARTHGGQRRAALRLIRQRVQSRTRPLTHLFGCERRDPSYLRHGSRRRRPRASEREIEMRLDALRRTDHPYEPLPLAERNIRRAAADRNFRRRLHRRQRRARLLVHVARRYHHTVRRLWRSDEADVEYGLGRREVVEWPYKGRAKKYPRRYHMAGVSDIAGSIIMTDHRGERHRLPLPPAKLIRAWRPDARHPVGLLAARTADPDVVACWAPVDGRWQVVGLACRGVEIPQSVAAGDYTAADIAAERNQEVRSVMAERYPGGPERLVADLGLEPVATDDRGQLYEMPGDLQRLVRVQDATPQADGSRRVYWLSVPPRCSTPTEAVAWTYGLPAGEYAPVCEA